MYDTIDTRIGEQFEKSGGFKLVRDDIILYANDLSS